jgi:hypothetical protein
LETTVHRKKRDQVMLPSENKKYLHPLFVSSEQHGAPGSRSALKQYGNGLDSEMLGEYERVGIKPKAIALLQALRRAAKIKNVV